MTTIPRLRAMALAAAVLAGAACGSESSLSPTGASSIDSRRGATINGRVTSSSRAASEMVAGAMATTSVTVTVVGTNISTVVDGDGQFTLTGVPPGDVTLRFTSGATSATITLPAVAATDRITVRVSLNGNSARIESIVRRNDDDDDEDDDEDDDDEDDDNEVEGRVSNLTGTCPALTFVVRGVTVTTNSATRFRDPCTRIANGIRVEAEGRRQNGTLIATEVEIDD